jgi:hypothetical protein
MQKHAAHSLYTITFGRGSSDEASFVITGGSLLMLDSEVIIE